MNILYHVLPMTMKGRFIYGYDKKISNVFEYKHSIMVSYYQYDNIETVYSINKIIIWL